VQRDEHARAVLAHMRRGRGQRQLVEQQQQQPPSLRVLVPAGPDHEQPAVRGRAGVRPGTVSVQFAERGVHAVDLAL